MKLEHILENYTCEIPYNDMFVKIRRFLLTETDGGIFAPVHSHKHFEFHYIVSGKGRITIEDTEFEVSTGSIFFTKPYINHSEISDMEDPMVQYTVECAIDFPESCKNIIDDFEIKLIEKVLNKVYHEGFFDDRDICGRFEKIRKITREKKLGYQMKIKLLILDCLIDTVTVISKKMNVKYPLSKESLNEKRSTIIKNFIDVNIGNDVTVDDVCKQVFLSARHANRIFIEKYNQTINQYILDTKINLVKKKLINTAEDIEEIALSVGFTSYQQMYRTFVKVVGITPGQYRKENKNKTY